MERLNGCMVSQPSPVFDEPLTLGRRLRAARAGEARHFLLVRAAEDMADRLSVIQRPFPEAAVLFSGRQVVPKALQASRPHASVTVIEADTALTADLSSDAISAVVSAPTTFGHLDQRFDLAVSLLAMQSVNDLPGFLVQARRILRPDGLFLGCLLGAGTLSELRDVLLTTESELTGGASPRVAPFADVRDMGGLLQRAGFALPVADVDEITVRYASLFGLIADLRAMGLTSTLTGRNRKPLNRAFWARAAQLYAERHADADGRIRATFNIIWVSGWVPDASQQKPLRPGSATVSLKDVL
jgi:SAM-dependent methyltransferase